MEIRERAGERAGWLHHAIVNGYSTHMWVLDQTTKMENEPFSNLCRLGAFHVLLSVPKSDVTALSRVAYHVILPVNVTQAL